MIKNIIFDFGNVLVRFRPETQLRRFTRSDEEADALRRLIYLSKPWKDTDRGLLTRQECIDALCKMHPDKEGLLREAMADCSSWLVMPEANGPLLKRLGEAGFGLFFLSNTNTSDYGSMCSRYPVIARMPGIASHLEHVIKPDPAIFRLIAERFRLDPSQCLFIDDMEENTASAAACGFRVLTLRGGADTLTDELMRIPEIGSRLKEV